MWSSSTLTEFLWRLFKCCSFWLTYHGITSYNLIYLNEININLCDTFQHNIIYSRGPFRTKLNSILLSIKRTTMTQPVDYIMNGCGINTSFNVLKKRRLLCLQVYSWHLKEAKVLICITILKSDKCAILTICLV